jgi:PEP-CTERM motif
MRFLSKPSLVLGTAIVAATFAAASAHAAIDFSVQSATMAGSNNWVANNSCTNGVINGGATIKGCVNGAGSNLIVQGSGNETLLIDSGQGQATITAQDGNFTVLTIDPINFTSDAIGMFIYTAPKSKGTVTFSNASGASSAWAVDSTGANQFIISSLVAGLDFITVTISGTTMTEVKQVRFDPHQNTNVPVPGTLVLMGAGLLALARKKILAA